MKRWLISLLFLLCLVSARPVMADNRFIVRDTSGLTSLQNACVPLSCSVLRTLDGSLGQLFLVTASNLIDPNLLISRLLSVPGVVDAEIDQLLRLQQSSGSGIPSGLYDSQPVNYFGATVWDGYVNQPAAQIVRIQDTQTAYSVTGAGTVAVIDTGIDPHPAFGNTLLSGYDFTRNTGGSAERNDVSQWDTTGQPGPAEVSQSTMAVVDPYNANTLSGSQYAAFGHGTMVAGIIHLVAPTASLMGLKAFKADGSGYLSDIMHAVYYAAQHNAKVINMSFTFPSSSKEMQNAVQYAGGRGVICAAAVGNDGADQILYPAGYTQLAMGVASTNDSDTLSSFSNYGAAVWVASPGEAIITTYPFNTYAAGWGTSFSTPFVAGAVALLVSLNSSVSQSQAATALGHAIWISSGVGQGRVDLYQALSAFTSQ
jgi:subtilisin family serine protease